MLCNIQTILSFVLRTKLHKLEVIAVLHNNNDASLISVDLPITILINQVTMDRRVPPPFPNTPDYVDHSSKVLEYISQPGKTLPKELVSPRYRAYPPLEMFSFPQSPINQDGTPSPQQQPIPTPRSRPGFLRRADSLVSSTELALFRRVHEAQQEALQETQYRQQVGDLLS